MSLSMSRSTILVSQEWRSTIYRYYPLTNLLVLVPVLGTGNGTISSEPARLWCLTELQRINTQRRTSMINARVILFTMCASADLCST